MMDNEEYRRKWEITKNWYHEAGYADNLIVSTGKDLDVIEQFVKDTFPSKTQDACICPLMSVLIIVVICTSMRNREKKEREKELMKPLFLFRTTSASLACRGGSQVQ